MIERTTVRLPSDLLRRAKRKAADQGRTLTALIEEGLRNVVTESGKPAKRRINLPVSRASGGLLPGVSIENSASLQESEDIDYVLRMKRG